MDEFAAVQASIGKTGVPGWWEKFDFSDEQMERLRAAGQNPSISHRAISIVLGNWGYKVSPQQVGNWRRTVLGTVLR